MPPSALEKLTRLHISYPMLFELRNGVKDTVSHAGVLEFIAEEGRIFLPQWVSRLIRLCVLLAYSWAIDDEHAPSRAR